MDNIKSNEDGTITFLTDIDCEVWRATMIRELDETGVSKQSCYVVTTRENKNLMETLKSFLKKEVKTDRVSLIKYSGIFCHVIIGDEVEINLKDADLTFSATDKDFISGKLVYVKRLVSMVTGESKYFLSDLKSFEPEGLYYLNYVNLLEVEGKYFSIYIFPSEEQFINIESADCPF